MDKLSVVFFDQAGKFEPLEEVLGQLDSRFDYVTCTDEAEFQKSIREQDVFLVFTGISAESWTTLSHQVNMVFNMTSLRKNPHMRFRIYGDYEDTYCIETAVGRSVGAISSRNINGRFDLIIGDSTHHVDSYAPRLAANVSSLTEDVQVSYERMLSERVMLE